MRNRFIAHIKIGKFPAELTVDSAASGTLVREEFANEILAAGYDITKAEYEARDEQNSPAVVGTAANGIRISFTTTASQPVRFLLRLFCSHPV